MKTRKDILMNLLKVKSLWSLMAGAMFVYLTVTGGISGEIALTVITSIVTYYFSKKDQMEERTDETDPELSDK